MQTQTEWLQTTFQTTIQVCLKTSTIQAPQQTPYIHKYESITSLLQLNKTDHPYQFIVYCLLGQIYNEVEQISDSIRCYHNALACLSQLEDEEVRKFYQYLIVVYNMLGLSYVNREDNQVGVGCLAKAYMVYEAYLECKGDDVYHNRSFQPKGRQFKFLYEGGVDHQQMQDCFTLTLFYLAQAYTKLDFKDKAAEYCGMTLQRQHVSKKYEPKQFVNNLIGLSEYHQGNKYYAQSQYLLMLAMKATPQDNQQLKAMIHISLGILIGQILDFGSKRIVHNDVNENDDKVINRNFIEFIEFDQPFPVLALPVDIQGCKSLFRQANTQFKKAMQMFVLDGYVTEHVQILFGISKLYKSLSYLEKSLQRQYSMLDKRRLLIEYLLTELSEKAFPGTWQKVLVQVSQITNDMFNLKVNTLPAKGFPSDERINFSCQLGKKSIKYYEMIIKTLEEDKDSQHNQQYYQSIINSKINIAKASSKLMSSDRKVRVQYLCQSYQLYKGILNYIKNDVPTPLRHFYSKQVELTQDMINMMPTKIDKVNYGQLTIIE